jgi:hypothetical protein
MGDDRLTSRKRGLGGKGFGDLFRANAPRCTRKADLECHHMITTAGSGLDNAQMLCKECHSSTETHGVSSGFSPKPFSEMVKLAATMRCAGQCECTKAHLNHGYGVVPPVPTIRSL